MGRLSPGYCGSEMWKDLVTSYQDRKELDREMVEAFIEKITAYNDGRLEIQFRNHDELESALYYAAERKREEVRYAV